MSKSENKEAKKAEVIELEEVRKRTKFNVQQRFTLLNMMPKEGGYFNIKKMREVKEALGLSDSEQSIFEQATVLIPGGTVTNWKKANDDIVLKRVDVGEWLANHFRTELKRQYDREKIREDTIDLYDMFCSIPKEKN